MEDALKYFPKVIERIRNTLSSLISIQDIDVSYENKSDDLKGQRIEKIIIPSNSLETSTRLEILLGLKFSGHTKTVTEASNLFDEIYKRLIYKTNSNIKTLLIYLTLIKWNYLVKY